MTSRPVYWQNLLKRILNLINMSLVRLWEIEGFKAEPPHERVLKVLLSPDRGVTKNISLGMTLLPPNSSSSYHAHDEEEEIWYVISGRGKAIIGNKEFLIERDVALYIPPKTQHQLVNTSDETLKILWIFSPPGPERPFLKGGRGKA